MGREGARAPRGEAFEAAMAERCGARRAIAVVSSTLGFQVALRALDLPPGASVLTTPLADPPVVRAALASAMRLRFADVDARGHLDPASVAAHVALHGPPAVVVPAHFAGHPCAVRAVEEAAAHAVVVEDATGALGALRSDDRPVGAPTHAAVVVLGVHPLRDTGPPQGAVLVTDDDALATRMRRLRDERPEHRLSELHATLGLVQLGRLSELIALRARIAALYDATVRGLALAEPIMPPPGTRSAWAAYPLRVPPWSRQAAIAQLQTWGVGGHHLPMPLHRHPYFGRQGDVRAGDLPATERLASEVLLLPTGATSGDGELARVIEMLATAGRESGRSCALR